MRENPNNNNPPSEIIQQTRMNLDACLKRIKVEMMIGENESIGNNPELIKVRKKMYEWEKKIYDEPNGTLHHRKFLRNYLIQLESGFLQSAKSPTGARGMMQLTTSIPDDMRNRPQLYIEKIQEIGFVPEVFDALPLHMRSMFRKIIHNSNKTIDISSLASYLASGEGRKILLSNAYVNAYFGSIYLGILHESVNEDTIPNELQYYAQLRSRINYSSINALIRDKLLSIEPNPGKVVEIPKLTPETYILFLNTLSKNLELARSVFAARRYNGSNTIKGYERYGSGIREKDVYFIAIGYATTMAMLTNNRYKSSYCNPGRQNSL